MVVVVDDRLGCAVSGGLILYLLSSNVPATGRGEWKLSRETGFGTVLQHHGMHWTAVSGVPAPYSRSGVGALLRASCAVQPRCPLTTTLPPSRCCPTGWMSTR